MANLFAYVIIITTITTLVTSHPFHKSVIGARRNRKRRGHHKHKGAHSHDSAELGGPLMNAFVEINPLTPFKDRNAIDDVIHRGNSRVTRQGHITNILGNAEGSSRTIGRENNRRSEWQVPQEYNKGRLPEVKKKRQSGGIELLGGEVETRTGEVMEPSREEPHIDITLGASSTYTKRLGLIPASLDTTNANVIFDNVDQMVVSRIRGGSSKTREHTQTDRRGKDVDCSQQACENMLQSGVGLSRRGDIRKRPPPVPLKSNTMKQVEDNRHEIGQYNDQLTETVPRGVLPPIPDKKMIVNLTGEEDAAVMENFGSFFHDFAEVPPSENNFRRRDGRHLNDREKRDGGHVYVCSHERTWEQIFLAFSANNGLVQLYQTEELRQYVLTNRCTERQSSVVPRVICVNEISTVNVVVLNFDTGLIQPTFINVETCRAKFVT